MRFLDMRYNGEYIIAMGDTIDCVALVNYLSQKEKLLVPCIYLDNVKSFFPKDANLNFTRISSYNVYAEHKKNYGALEIYPVSNDKAGDFQHFEIAKVYETAGLPYSERHKYCTIASQAALWPQIEPPKEPYAFIPEGGSPKLNGGQGYKIDREYVGDGLLEVIPPQNAMMLAYAKIIENAEEIHCHATSWYRLIEKLPTKGKLFFHHIRHTNMKPENYRKFEVLTKPWNEL